MNNHGSRNTRNTTALLNTTRLLALQQTKKHPNCFIAFLDVLLLPPPISILPFFSSPLLIFYPILSSASALLDFFLVQFCSFCRRVHACFSHPIPTLLLFRVLMLHYILVCGVFVQPLLNVLPYGETGLVLSRSFVPKRCQHHIPLHYLSSFYLFLPHFPFLPCFHSSPNPYTLKSRFYNVLDVRCHSLKLITP